MLAAEAARLEVKVFSVDMGFLLAMLPPGAFISLGLLIAARNWLTRRHAS
jgi:electron transport complex protein RnfE